MPKGFRKIDGKPTGCSNKGKISPQRNGKYVACQQCGKPKYFPKCRLNKRKFCSQKCMGEYKTGRPINLKEKNGNWTGEEHKSYHGYIFVYKPDHPFADRNKYVKRSRLVLEQHLGRYLKPEEIPHHINRIKDDDRIENLMLFSNHSEHMKFHHPQKSPFPKKIS